MAKYDWNDFRASEYYIQLSNFFQNLYQTWENDKKIVFVFISRKAFCLFLLMKKMNRLECWNDIKVYSDRFLMKNLNKELFCDNTVILVDDAVITGRHLQDSIQVVQKRTSAKEIVSFIFIAEELAWANDRNASLVEKLNLTWFQLASRNDILKFSSIESLMFYSCGIPYMVELPFLSEKATDGEHGIHIQNTEFELLKSQNESWEYYECPQTGYLQNDMTSGVMILKNNVIKLKFLNLIQNMAVRVHIINEDGGYRLIFIPFAILKSVHFDKLLNFFDILYLDTEYKELVMNYHTLCDEQGWDFAENSYIAIYRAVVYSLSYYIGKELQKYINDVLGRSLVFDTYLNQYSFEPLFIQSVEKVFADDKYLANYIRRVVAYPSFQQIECRQEIRKIGDNYPMREYSYQRSCAFILEIINDFHHTDDRNLNLDIVLIEEIEYLFENSFYLGEYGESMGNYISRSICSMLSQGVFTNEIIFEKSSDTVYRGFGYGENSDVFYDISAKVFYAAVYKYYTIIGTRYSEKYNFFVMNLYRFFCENILMDSLISRDEFEFYAKYFRRAGNEQIENKCFLLDDKTIPYYIQRVEEFIDRLDFD